MRASSASRRTPRGPARSRRTVAADGVAGVPVVPTERLQRLAERNARELEARVRTAGVLSSLLMRRLRSATSGAHVEADRDVWPDLVAYASATTS